MHGRVKVRTTAEQKEAKKKEQDKKLLLYQNAMNKIFSKRTKGEQDHAQLNITASVLQQNPDVYTLWNIRKEVLLKFKAELSTVDFDSLLLEDLKLTEQCLGVNPKSYGVWHHRTWVMNKMAIPRWEFELKLCNKALELDDRNFHCWDYRRFVASKSKVSDKDELEFSTKKVSGNFSNYSAWHYRSELLPRVHPSDADGRPAPEILEKELKLVQNAMFTDPNDQSAFFYHRWLLGRKEPPLACSQLIASVRSDVLTITVSTTSVCQSQDLSVKLDGSPVDWTFSSTGGEYSDIWVTSQEGLKYPCSVGITVKTSTIAFTATADLNNHRVMANQDVLPSFKTMTLEDNVPAPETVLSSRVLASEVESLQQLRELEPENKWVLLTLVHMLSVQPKLDNEMMDIIKKLKEIDPYRKCYYDDLRSKMTIEDLPAAENPDLGHC